MVAHLSTFSTDTSCQLDVFGHYGDSLGMDGTEISILEETNQISLARLLKRHDSCALEA